MMKRRYKEKNLRIPGEKRSRQRIENYIQLEEYVKFSALKGDVGSALLSDNKNIQNKFGYRIDGIHPTISDQQFATAVNFLVDGFKAIPDGETITVIQSVVPDNRARLSYYRQLAADAPTHLFKEM